MEPIAIAGIALGVGVVVYALSLRGEAEEVLELGQTPGAAGEPEPRGHRRRSKRQARAVGFRPEDAAGEDDGAAYLRVVPAAETPWTTRIASLVGIIVLIGFSAVLLAAAIYQAGHVINQAISGFLEK